MATYWENSCSFGLRYVSWYKFLIVSLVFSHLGFWSGNLFLIAPFPDLCLLVPFNDLDFSDIFDDFRWNRRIGYNLNVMRQSACLFFNPIMVDNYAAFFNCMPVGRASDSMMAPT